MKELKAFLTKKGALVGMAMLCTVLVGLVSYSADNLMCATPEEEPEGIVLTERDLSALRFPVDYQLREYDQITINQEPPDFPSHDPGSVPLPRGLEAPISEPAPAETRIPPPPARCPEPRNASVSLGNSDIHSDIQQFLNDGGSVPSVEKLLNYHESIQSGYATGGASARVLHQDLTGDSVPDVLIVGQSQFRYYASRIKVAFFSCKDGRYEGGSLLSTEGRIFGCRGRGLWAVEDMNGNGVPEVVLAYGDKDYTRVQIWEWDGSQMVSLVDHPGGAIHLTSGDGRLADVDGNGSLELLVLQGLSCTGRFYQHDRLDIFAWDGDHFRRAYWEDLAQSACPTTAYPGWTNYSTYDAAVGNDRIAALAVAPDGALWAGTWGGGASRFDGETWTSYTPQNSPLGEDVVAIAVAPNGALWFGSRGVGISRFDGQTWSTYTLGDGLPNTQILAIAVGADGTAWVGTERGLSSFDGESWTIVREPDLTDIWITDIAVESGESVWVIAATRGAFHYDGVAWAPFATEEGLGDDPARWVTLAREGGVWFAVRNTVAHWDGQRWTRIGACGDVSHGIQALAIDREGAPWAVMGDSLGRFDGQSWHFYPLPGESQISPQMAPLAPGADGTIWVGTHGQGLYRYTPQD